MQQIVGHGRVVVDVDVRDAEAGMLLRKNSRGSDAERACRIDDVVRERLDRFPAPRRRSGAVARWSRAPSAWASWSMPRKNACPARSTLGRVGCRGRPTVDDAGETADGADRGRQRSVGLAGRRDRPRTRAPFSVGDRVPERATKGRAPAPRRRVGDSRAESFAFVHHEHRRVCRAGDAARWRRRAGCHSGT